MARAGIRLIKIEFPHLKFGGHTLYLTHPAFFLLWLITPREKIFRRMQFWQPNRKFIARSYFPKCSCGHVERSFYEHAEFFSRSKIQKKSRKLETTAIILPKFVSFMFPWRRRLQFWQHQLKFFFFSARLAIVTFFTQVASRFSLSTSHLTSLIYWFPL